MPETRSGWETALTEVSSPSWTRRVRAGHDLASFTGIPEVAEALVGLLLDAEDTAVTRGAAEALARVGTVTAMRLVALALSRADDNQADWLQTGVHDALVGPGSAPDLVAVCRKLARHPEEAVRRGAAEISVWVDTGRHRSESSCR
ncbi:HEAT repeat domain-containing protein [Streptomyces sudanensis]|uniref:HEAT repeat domain-containing protein n=1 Tax=Streptomyces sudanensis TaxID=436397 RepID=UPI0020CF2987|nr:HEAT repeat domain-containing protein [Streptomyces sudanensis]MCP9956787.1 HEAT repeat domain-containing protein [Streptomyces sudanensis]MCP9985990.1 HEAT repeat domain-containing protein [Streptomyces sudanensis]MCQ0002623.1 HEAT repeat domain-containing protein [Streptomyces sudanensis]